MKSFFVLADDPSMDIDIINQWEMTITLLTIEKELNGVVGEIKENVITLDETMTDFKLKLNDLANRIKILEDGPAGDLVRAVKVLQSEDCGEGTCGMYISCIVGVYFDIIFIRLCIYLLQ